MEQDTFTAIQERLNRSREEILQSVVKLKRGEITLVEAAEVRRKAQRESREVNAELKRLRASLTAK